MYTVNVYNESDRKEEGYYEQLGITPDTSTYYAYYTCGILGSCLIQDVWDKAVSEEEKMFPKQQNDSAKLSPAFGFTLNTDNVKTEVTAITNAVSYTHLDVYKRQGLYRGPGSAGERRAGEQFPEETPGYRIGIPA